MTTFLGPELLKFFSLYLPKRELLLLDGDIVFDKLINFVCFDSQL